MKDCVCLLSKTLMQVPFCNTCNKKPLDSEVNKLPLDLLDLWWCLLRLSSDTVADLLFAE